MLASVMEPGREPEEDLAVRLARAMRSTSFYDVDHPVVQEEVADAHRQLTIYLAGTRDFAIQFVDGYVVLREKPLVRPHNAVGNLMGACHRRGVESLVFRPGLLREEIGHLVRVLTTDPQQLEEEGGVSAALAARGVSHIAAERFVRGAENDWRSAYMSALDVLRNAAASARAGRALDTTGIQAGVRGILDSLMRDSSIVENLVALKKMDEYTFVHALHICILACELGRQLSLPRTDLDSLGMATLLHDMGKVFVPLGILRKPAGLTDAEFAVMKRHPVDGAIVLARESRLPKEATVVAFEHHMHLDLSGYPQVREPHRFHLFSLMTNIADVYDALTTARPYRPALPPHQAVQVMKGELASHLEPRLFQHFLATLGPYPCGTLLGLPGGGLAVVIRRDAADPMNPCVRRIVLEGTAKRPRLVGEEVPLRALCPAGGEPDPLDPLSFGIDLPVLLHGAST